MASKFIKELMKKGFQKLSGQGKTTGKEGIKFIKSDVGKLKKIKDGKDRILKITDTYAAAAKNNPNLLKNFRKGSKKSLDGISKIYKGKKDGGRMGLKFGGGADLKDIPAGKKFNGLRKLPKEVRNKMKYKKDGGKI